jgi:hypothetical protein
MALFSFIETFFFISLGITFVLVLLLVYHFKNKISSLEKESTSLFEILNNVVKEMNIFQHSISQLKGFVLSQHRTDQINRPVYVTNAGNDEYDDSEDDSEGESEDDGDSECNSDDMVGDDINQPVNGEPDNKEEGAEEDAEEDADEDEEGNIHIHCESIASNANENPPENEYENGNENRDSDYQIVNNDIGGEPEQSSESIVEMADIQQPDQDITDENNDTPDDISELTECYVDDNAVNTQYLEVIDSDTPSQEISQLITDLTNSSTDVVPEEHMVTNEPKNLQIEFDHEPYKKMNVHTLREIAMSKGLITEQTKIKKPDLISLLETSEKQGIENK